MVARINDVAIFALCENGNVQTWNEGAYKIYKFKRHEVIDKHISIFNKSETEQECRNDALLQAAELGTFTEKGWRVRKDGSMFWAEVMVAQQDTGDNAGFVVVTRDLTAQQIYESQLKRARDNAVRDSQFKSQFVANVTHELRTPVTSIVGLSELLLAGDVDPADAQCYATTLHESSKMLLTMLNELLNYSKLQARKATIEKENFSLKQTIEEVLELVRFMCEEKNLNLDLKVDADLPEEIVGDETKTRQILLNLVNNAIKFTESGGIKIVCKTVDDYVHIYVIDSGLGIAKDKQEDLFEPFSQVHKEDGKSYGGTGLGLSIAQQSCESMGGKITVDSKLGEGSSFCFTIPINSQVK